MVQGVAIENGHIVDTNPATGAVIQRVRVSTNAEVDKAVQAARTAQPSWNARSLHERTELVKKACAALAGKRQQLAKLITAEMGKTLAESLEEVGVSVRIVRHRRATARWREGRRRRSRRSTTTST